MSFVFMRWRRPRGVGAARGLAAALKCGGRQNLPDCKAFPRSPLRRRLLSRVSWLTSHSLLVPSQVSVMRVVRDVHHERDKEQDNRADDFTGGNDLDRDEHRGGGRK